MNKILRALKHPGLVVSYLGHHGFFHGMSDERYLSICYKAYIGKKLDLQNPTGFNEKLQWLKIHDRNPAYTDLVDKCKVKEWVGDRIGQEYVIPTYKVWDSVDDIDISELPEQFVLKTNHESGVIAVCRDKASFDLEAAKKRLRPHLDTNYFWCCREWPYKNVEPVVFAEKYIAPSCGGSLDGENPSAARTDSPPLDLVDYKLMCFGGKVRCIVVCTGRATGNLGMDFFDPEWNKFPLTWKFPNSDSLPKAPENLDEMIRAAECLSADFTFVRVDFYEVDGKTLFGEMTFYPGGGLYHFDPEEWDETLGSWIDLETIAGK